MKKLTLQRTTLATLAEDEASRAAGGVGAQSATSHTCWSRDPRCSGMLTIVGGRCNPWPPPAVPTTLE